MPARQCHPVVEVQAMWVLVRRAPMFAGAVLIVSSVSNAQGRAEKARPNQPSRVLTTAKRYLGTKYILGGTTPRGFDCSGFVQYVFRRHGVRLPRTSRQQAAAGRRVPSGLGSLRPGDLLLFATRGKRIDHIAIYAGGNRIIHSSASGGGVRYDNLSSKRGKWFVRHHVASRRVLREGTPLVAAVGMQTEVLVRPNLGAQRSGALGSEPVTQGVP
jgi:hypothetical protein